jgi:hypothetical protein
MQIASAVFGDIEGEKLNKLRAERELLEIELSEKRSKLINAEHACRAWTDIIIAMRQIIKGSSLSDSEKNQLFTNMRELTIDEIVSRTADLSQSSKEGHSES